MNIIDQVTEVFSDFQNEMNDLKDQNEKLKKEISELRKLLVAGETLRSQYVLCCAMNVKPEIIMQYVKSNNTELNICECARAHSSIRGQVWDNNIWRDCVNHVE